MINETRLTGNAVVIGAGTMGGGIAAQLANAGWRVRLLDIAGADPAARNQAAASGLERIKTRRPPLLYLPEFADRIEIGNTEDHLDWLVDADWVVEAVAENRELKAVVMALIEAHAGPETVISSNTSGLSLSAMTTRRSPEFARRFFGTHFLNPPRYLKLLEMVMLPGTDPEIARAFSRFAEYVLGHRVVFARDTPGFISTRIGIWHLIDCIHSAVEHGLTIEEADAVTGSLIGRPRSGAFRLADIIGLDILADIARDQYERLPTDPFRDRLILPPFLTQLIQGGHKGDKSGAGFYKGVGKEKLALDFQTLEYRALREPNLAGLNAISPLPLPERLAAIGREKDVRWAQFLNAIQDSLTAYVRHAAPDIADDALSIDHVMMWGFNWEIGPCEMSDIRGNPETMAERYYRGAGPARKYRIFCDQEWQPMPEDPEYLSLAELKESGHVILHSDATTLIDLGDGVACLEFHTKMNTINPALSAFINEARALAERDFAALVIGNQGPHFSAGYDLKLLLQAIEAKLWTAIDTMLHDVQSAYLELKYAKVPVVAAPHGYTLGAGCECVLHCHAVQASPELTMGLPELNAGLVPAGGGIVELMARAMAGIVDGSDPFHAVERVFNLIAFPRNSSSAAEARQLGFLRETDGVSRNADRRLYEAKQRALALANAGYAPPQKHGIRVLGAEALARLRLGLHARHRDGGISDHDQLIADIIATICSGGHLPYAREVSEEYLLQLERAALIELAHEPKSVARIRHMLETGKPLKN